MPSNDSPFVSENLHERLTRLRKEAMEFEALVCEARKDLEQVMPESKNERDNGNERIRRAIAMGRQKPNFDDHLEKLSQAKEIQMKLKSECELIKERVEMCLKNPIFNGTDEHADSGEAKDTECTAEKSKDNTILDSFPAEMKANLQAQILLEASDYNENSDELAREYQGVLEDIKRSDAEFLALVNSDETPCARNSM